MILEKLQQIFKEIFADDNLEIAGETTAEDIPEWDSLAQVLIVEAVEKEFDIKMNLDEVFKMKSVNDFIQAVEASMK